MIPLDTYRRDQGGASAAEFALVVPLFLALVLGVIHMSLLVYSAVQLHYATEWTARCLSVSANNPSSALSKTTCPNMNNFQSYATGRYTGPGINPQFSLANSATCGTSYGRQLTGSEGSITEVTTGDCFITVFNSFATNGTAYSLDRSGCSTAGLNALPTVTQYRAALVQ